MFEVSSALFSVHHLDKLTKSECWLINSSEVIAIAHQKENLCIFNATSLTPKYAYITTTDDINNFIDFTTSIRATR